VSVRGRWPFRLALLTVPRGWRESVGLDLESESRSGAWAAWWCAGQAIAIGLRWHWTFTRDAIMSDIRYAIRSLMQARWFTVGAVATFVLGMGVNVAVFAAVDRMLFRRLPYARSHELVLLRSCAPKTGECTSGSFPSAVAFDLQRASTTMRDVTAAGSSRRWRTDPDPSSDTTVALTSVAPNMLRTLGVRPVIGRDIDASEANGRRCVAWLSDEAWEARFGHDTSILGRRLWLGSHVADVIGVLPRGFIPAGWASQPANWEGLVVDFDSWSTISVQGGVMAPIARLRPGVSVSAAQAEVAALVQVLGPRLVRPGGVLPLVRVDRLESTVLSRFQRYMWLVVSAAGMVLLMACANLASLLVARGRSREQVAAILTALGASRGRLVTTVLCESVIVCLAGAAVALAALGLTGRFLSRVLPPLFVRYAEGVADYRILGVALGAALLCAVLAGVVPAWRQTRVDVVAALQLGSRGGRRVRRRGGRGLLVLETALGTLLVLGSAMTLRSFVALTHDNLGFVPDGLYITSVERVTPPTAPLALDAAQTGLSDTLDIVRRLPGVVHAGTADWVPTTPDRPAQPMAKDEPRGSRVEVTADYLEALGVRTIAGRTLTGAEIATGSSVALLNRSGAHLLWPDAPAEAAVGRRWQPTGESAREIIGVIEDVKDAYGGTEIIPAVFMAFDNVRSLQKASTVVVVRVAHDTTLDGAALRQRLNERFGPTRMTVAYVPDTLDTSLLDARFRAALFLTLALIGLGLAAVGLYAIASFDVARRRYEIGVRIALGATPQRIRQEILGSAFVPVATGLTLGFMGAYWLAQVVQSCLFRVDGRDLATYGVVAVVLGVTALLAAWFPARRAGRVDPAVALHAE
jgi:putative ABC transport system permease protein